MNTKVEDLMKVLHSKPRNVELTPDQTEILMMSLLGSQQGHTPEINWDEIPWQMKMWKDRAEVLGIDIDLNLYPSLFMMVISPGQTTIILAYLKFRLKELGQTKVTLELFSEKIFPFGYFSKSTLDEIWDLNKVDGSSLLDHSINYESLNN